MKTILFSLCAACILLFTSTGFTHPEVLDQPDLVPIFPITFVKQHNSVCVYEFKIKNTGTKKADLRLMKIKTFAGTNRIFSDDPVEGFPMRLVSELFFLDMHYDRPQNGERLAPGATVTVRAKVDCGFFLPIPGQEGFYMLDVIIDSTNNVAELDEVNNFMTSNSNG
jgi:CARDB